MLITALAVGERARAFKAISPGMLPPLAIIFALLVGFLAAQVWSDADRASTAVNREASALRAAVLLAAGFPGEPEARLRDLIRRYIQDAVTQEWPAMARRNATLTIAPRAAGRGTAAGALAQPSKAQARSPPNARSSHPSRMRWRHAGSASFSVDRRSTG